MPDWNQRPTPTPWPDDLAVPIPAGDRRLLINGNPPVADCRVISEGNYQVALAAVNALAILAEAIDRRRTDA